MNINLGILETAHSIFREWHARSDAFWLIIKLVHSKFLVLYFQLFKMTIKLLPATRCQNPSTRRLWLYSSASITTSHARSCLRVRASCSSWRGTCHSFRQTYVVVASLPLDLSHFQPDEPTPSLPPRICTVSSRSVRCTRPPSSAFHLIEH